MIEKHNLHLPENFGKQRRTLIQLIKIIFKKTTATF